METSPSAVEAPVFKISFEAIKCPTAGVGEILARKEAEAGTIA
jgi:hypothetical protein